MESRGEEINGDNVNKRYGLGAVIGNSYDPVGDIYFYMLSGFVLFDYERIWHHSAPEPLRFKVEYNIGAAKERGASFMTSINMFALFYPDLLKDDVIKPYIEGGIGIIYTDFRVEGQGLKINFNPQVGIGMEFGAGSGDAYFLCFRLHHISNGDLYKDNRGVNSALLMLGRYF
ncbi:MAG: acyloxyacyl hydrolase [Deltaproteobacteria bacterium]|nr:acyloxyacyl hydrolase [Deltaproteobacteria bacterium]